MGKLEGKRALVLCGSSGIGFGIASELKNEGARVAITGRSQEKLKQAQLKMGLDEVIPVDHAEKGVTALAVSALMEKWGGIDVLVLHSPAPIKGKIELLSLDDWQEGYQKVTLSALEAIQAALPFLKKSLSPRIIFVLSTAAKEPIAGLLISSTLRAGMLGLSKSLSRDLAGDQITVNCVLPGYTKTSDAVIAAGLGHLEQVIPLRRLAEPFEHGKLVTYLASPDASYITGQVIGIEGGLIRGN